MIESIKKWFRKLFGKGTDYQVLYEEQKILAQNWEFKYNKLYRQLRDVVDENM